MQKSRGWEAQFAESINHLDICMFWSAKYITISTVGLHTIQQDTSNARAKKRCNEVQVHGGGR